jgi:hypothetical protein
MNLSLICSELKLALKGEGAGPPPTNEELAEYVSQFQVAETEEIAFYCGYLLGMAAAVGMTVGELLEEEDD